MVEPFVDLRVADHDELSRARDLVLERVATVERSTRSRFPLYADSDGSWYTTGDGNWCAGHWIGLLLLAARHASSETSDGLRAAALDSLDRMLTQPTGNIFAGLNHFYAGFFAYDVDGDERWLEVGLRGAEAMAGLYDDPARQIPIGSYRVAPSIGDENAAVPDLHRIAAVDVVHTSVPVLWRAHRHTGESRYWEIATAHSRRHLDWHLRSDASTIQLTRFDEDGAVVEQLNPLARDAEGCWSRGLAWSIAGLADAYAATGSAEFLDALNRSVEHLVGNEPMGLPRWDLTDPDPAAVIDSSAAAIIACGLVKLDPADPATVNLRTVGKQLLTALIDRCLVTGPDAPDRGAIRHGCYWKPFDIAVDNELIWGDFYTAAALSQLAS